MKCFGDVAFDSSGFVRVCLTNNMSEGTDENNGRRSQWPHEMWLNERVWHCHVRTRKCQSLEER